MYLRTELITPVIANEYLARDRDDNRPLSKQWVSRLAEMMRNGEWQLTPQGISFDKNGRLVDGQHRLAADVRAGIPVEMAVIYDAPTDINIYDRGKARSVRDILAMADIRVTTNMVSAVAFLFKYAGGGFRKNDPQFERFFAKHCNSVHTACMMSRVGSHDAITRTAPFTAGIWCALVCDFTYEDKLRRFCKVINSGLYDGDAETSGIVMRNFLFASRMRKSSTEKDNGIFRMTQTAFRDFASGKPRKLEWKTPTACYFDKTVAEDMIYEALLGSDERS